MGNRQAFSPLTILAVIKDHQGGMPASRVGKMYRISPNTVIRWSRQWGHEAEGLPNLATASIQADALPQ